MSDSWLSDVNRGKLVDFVRQLVNQNAARTIVPPDESLSGFWFGGGNVIQDHDGSLLACGRYRSGGDSRTGIQAGTRGRELAVFRSRDGGQDFEKILSWDKQKVAPSGMEVLSIEGSCLTRRGAHYQLYVSTEKRLDYPESLRDYQKPGAGVWTIDLLQAESLDALATAVARPVLRSDVPGHLHVKDPFLWDDADSDGSTSLMLGFCSHPFGWSSSNSGRAILNEAGTSAEEVQHAVISRGTTWDVAMTRATCVLSIPAVGDFAERAHTIVFYCGGECLRSLEEHGKAHQRPRGYSCEEIGGAVVYVDGDLSTATRLSDLEALFVSPWGTGCSRYVDVLETENEFIVTWQQSKTDESQPLVLNRVPRSQVEQLLK